jgi:hypothetical protein
LTSRTHLAVCHHMTSALVGPWIDRPMCLPCSSFILPLTNSHTHSLSASPALPFTPLFLLLQRATWVVQGHKVRWPYRAWLLVQIALTHGPEHAWCLPWWPLMCVASVTRHDGDGFDDVLDYGLWSHRHGSPSFL